MATVKLSAMRERGGKLLRSGQESEARLKRSALAHAPLQINQKQEDRFQARDVRRLMGDG
jgi:hypothetical protein